MSLRLRIVGAGKVRERFWQAAMAEYQKRLPAYARLEIGAVADEPVPERLSAAEAVAVKEREGQRLLRALDPGQVVVALDGRGTTMSSEGFAAWLAERALAGQSSLAFVIGGTLGLADAVLARADLKLSLGPMTFPHQMVPVLLLEQIYRACRINAGEPYHK